jgi:hypothetical protein
MRKFQKQIPAALKALGVGGVLGSTLGIALFHMFPQTRAAGLSVRDSMLVSAALMSLVSRILQAIGPTVLHYLRNLELSLEVKIGWMAEHEARKFREGLQRRHYKIG